MPKQPRNKTRLLRRFLVFALYRTSSQPADLATIDMELASPDGSFLSRDNAMAAVYLAVGSNGDPIIRKSVRVMGITEIDEKDSEDWAKRRPELDAILGRPIHESNNAQEQIDKFLLGLEEKEKEKK